MHVEPRSTWTRTPRPVSKLFRMQPDQVKGVAIHYTGSGSPLGQTATLDLSARRLEDERRFHTTPPPQGRGWSDIAYQVAMDVEGRIFDARGVGYRSAANGNAVNNRLYGAVVWLIGVGDRPTPALIDAFRWWRHEHWLPRYPTATDIVGHRDLYSTACPGDPTYELIRSGRLAARPAAARTLEDDDMAMSPEERAALVRDIARETAELITGTTTALHPVLVAEGTGSAELRDGRDIDAIPTVLREIQDDVRSIKARLNEWEPVADGSAGQ